MWPRDASGYETSNSLSSAAAAVVVFAFDPVAFYNTRLGTEFVVKVMGRLPTPLLSSISNFSSRISEFSPST